MSTSPIDPAGWGKLRLIAPAQLRARRDGRAQPIPHEVSFKLTNRCDLRCAHCYQWGADGYHRHLPQVGQREDLPLAIVARVLEETRPVGSNLFLWGGEPLVYRHWEELIDLLATERRWTSICTNGTLIPQRLASLSRISDQLELSISLDGFQAEHDAVRGSGTFSRTLDGVRHLVEARRQGSYRGEVTVANVISDALTGRLYDFVRFLEDEGVGAVYLGFPWYISPETATRMDAYFAAHFPERPMPEQASWRSYAFKIDPSRLDALRTDLARVASAAWRIKVRFNPELSADELVDFLAGSDRPAQGKTRCLALSSRLDVFPDGNAVSCKFFPEMTVGDLRDRPLADVWYGRPYEAVRDAVATHGLMPICAKCNLLYTRGA